MLGRREYRMQREGGTLVDSMNLDYSLPGEALDLYMLVLWENMWGNITDRRPGRVGLEAW